MISAWIPSRAGLAVGLGSMAFGFGSISSIAMYQYLIERFGSVISLKVSAAMTATITLHCAAFAAWPPHTRHEGVMDPSKDREPVFSECPADLHGHSLLQQRRFWVYALVLFTIRSGYAFVVQFFMMGTRFGQDPQTLAHRFMETLLIATVSRPVAGLLCDNMKRRRGFFSLGSKNIVTLFLLVQSSVFLHLASVCWIGDFAGFARDVTVVMVVLSAGSSTAPILARDVFGARNGALVFGAGGALGFGTGSFGWAQMVLDLEDSRDEYASRYRRFFLLASLLNAVGVVACLSLTRGRNMVANKKVLGVVRGLSQYGAVEATGLELKDGLCAIG